MKRALHAFGVALLAGGAIGCRSPAAPTPMCQTNNTGTIAFTNASRTLTYRIVWDGVQIITVLAPLTTSPPVTAAAGVAHTLIFRSSASTSNVACSATPILVRCQEITLRCPVS